MINALPRIEGENMVITNVTNGSNDTNDVVTCPECETAIGEIVEYAGQEWLQVGAVIVRALHGACNICGREFHWSVGDRALSELVRRVMNARGLA